jgi:hypothetical protein
VVASAGPVEAVFAVSVLFLQPFEQPFLQLFVAFAVYMDEKHFSGFVIDLRFDLQQRDCNVPVRVRKCSGHRRLGNGAPQDLQV